MRTCKFPLPGLPSGLAVLNNPALNKSTAFTEEERDLLGLRGLLPPRVCSQREQVLRVMQNFHRKPDDIEKYIFMAALQDRNQALFYRVILDDPVTMLPILYTPTVGEACQKFGQIYRRPRGMFISANDRGRIARVLSNWPYRNVKVIVVTDGERILGLGDLGASGMGIPVGKLTLYTACGGIDPTVCLPITLDVGTENQTLREDPLYLGLPQRRLRGEPYDSLLEEFMQAVDMLFPGVLVQFEDFGTHNAMTLLERYRHRYCCFNDDIQGTGAVTLAGLINAARLSGSPIRDQRFLLYGAGEAGVGIANAIVQLLQSEGLPESQALEHCWLIDTQGLIVRSRDNLTPHKRRFARDHAPLKGLSQIVEQLRPTALIGVCGQPKAFTPEVLKLMAHINERPIVFALSNPTSKSECSAEEAYRETDGRAIFASGSPFPSYRGPRGELVPGQCNNAYIFPGVGLGAVLSGARQVPDSLFGVAARTLANLATAKDLQQGRVFPGLERIREVSAHIAAAVLRQAHAEGLASEPLPADPLAHAKAAMYHPDYHDSLG